MQNYTGNDIYCDLIIPRKLNVDILKETQDVLAYYHTRPHWEVHIVVTPKIHVASLLELSGSLTENMLTIVQEMACLVKQNYGGCRVITNLGGYQDSKHLHVHVCYGKVRA